MSLSLQAKSRESDLGAGDDHPRPRAAVYPQLHVAVPGERAQAGLLQVLPEEEGQVVPGHVVRLAGQQQQPAQGVRQEVEGQVQVAGE